MRVLTLRYSTTSRSVSSLSTSPPVGGRCQEHLDASTVAASRLRHAIHARGTRPAALELPCQDEASGTRLNRFNFQNDCRIAYSGHEQVSQTLLSVWAILQQQNLIAPSDGDWFFVTKKGEEAASGARPGLVSLDLLPKELLHPTFPDEIAKAFRREDFRGAIRDAFLEVEIAVREGGGYPDDLVGEKLMGAAFHVESGKLMDPELPKAEREGMLLTFTGAMKLFRNPVSHRRIKLGAEEAARTIAFASLLRSIVESRTAAVNADEHKPGRGPVVSYDLGFTKNVFVLDVRVGNRGHKPLFLSEVWLCSPKRGQAICVFSNNDNPTEIRENCGRVYAIELTYEDAKPYAKRGASLEVTDATGRKYRKPLSSKSVAFLAKDLVTELGLLESPVDNPPSLSS